MKEDINKKELRDSRRDFLKKIIAPTAIFTGVNVQAKEIKDTFFSPLENFKNTEKLRVGIVGIGGRGTGAVDNILRADRNTELVAIGDIHGVNIGQKISTLQRKFKNRIKPKVFLGLDSYKKVINSGIDIVILATPPCFRPQHLAYAIDKNKHIFAEKPLAIDAVGLRSIIETAKKAKKKKLSILTGFVWRYTKAAQGLYDGLLRNKVGDILSAHSYYLSSGRPKRIKYLKSRSAYKAYAETFLPYLRKWTNFLELSGDSILEQSIHSVDKLSWVMGDQKPKYCLATGGQGEAYQGNTFDHFSISYHYKGGKQAFLSSAQIPNARGGVYDEIRCQNGMGILKSHASISDYKGKSLWKSSKVRLGYIHEHSILLSYIRSGKVFSDLDSAINSTGMAIMGRMASYTGKLITWDDMMESKENLFDWNAPLNYETKYKVRDLAIPGVTKYV